MVLPLHVSLSSLFILANMHHRNTSSKTTFSKMRWKRENLHNGLPPPNLDIRITRRNNTVPDNHILRAYFYWCDLVVDSSVCENELHHVGCEPAPRTVCRGGVINVFSSKKGKLWKKSHRKGRGNRRPYQECLPNPNTAKRSSLVDRYPPLSLLSVLSSSTGLEPKVSPLSASSSRARENRHGSYFCGSG